MGLREGESGLEAYLTLDHFLSNLDGCFAEGASVLGTDLCTHCEVGGIITVGLRGGEGKGGGRGEEGEGCSCT